jgi:hypothetical protein
MHDPAMRWSFGHEFEDCFRYLVFPVAVRVEAFWRCFVCLFDVGAGVVGGCSGVLVWLSGRAVWPWPGLVDVCFVLGWSREMATHLIHGRCCRSCSQLLIQRPECLWIGYLRRSSKPTCGVPGAALGKYVALRKIGMKWSWCWEKDMKTGNTSTGLMERLNS